MPRTCLNHDVAEVVERPSTPTDRFISAADARTPPNVT